MKLDIPRRFTAITVILFQSTAFVDSFLLSHKLEQRSVTMGIGASLSQKETTGSQPTEARETDADDSWNKAVEDFKHLLLDESYLQLPVRANTIEAAAQYPPSELSTTAALMPGSHKHLGGAYDPTDGTIYGVPANSRAVLYLKYDKEVNSYKIGTIPLPDSIKDCKMKWLRGIFAHGYLWAIPSWAPKVLCVDVDAYWGRRDATGDIVQLLDLPDDHVGPMSWQWHGAGINQEKTAIYCIPSNAQKVLKVDLLTKNTSLISIDYDQGRYSDFKLELPNKWYGGIIGADNCVYGVPYRSCAVLKIDCNKDSASMVGPNYGVNKYNWHGGIQVNGKIYAHPSHADTVLIINTQPGVTGDAQFSEIPIVKAEYDTDQRKNYKWLGGSVGVDGNIYCPACDTSAALLIDTKADTATTFGFAGMEKNKWQGGVRGRDGCVYSIPASGTHILRMATGDAHAVQLIGELPKYKDKWQGGHQGIDGSLYFIPENGYRVLKVTPPESPPQIIDGKLPDDDVIIEMI